MCPRVPQFKSPLGRIQKLKWISNQTLAVFPFHFSEQIANALGFSPPYAVSFEIGSSQPTPRSRLLLFVLIQCAVTQDKRMFYLPKEINPELVAFVYLGNLFYFASITGGYGLLTYRGGWGTLN